MKEIIEFSWEELISGYPWVPFFLKASREAGLEMSQAIIRMFIDNDIKPGERLEVIFKDDGKEYVKKVFYEIEGESGLFGIPFELEGKKYLLFFEEDDSDISPINPYDSLFIEKLYNPFKHRFAPQEK